MVILKEFLWPVISNDKIPIYFKVSIQSLYPMKLTYGLNGHYNVKVKVL